MNDDDGHSSAWRAFQLAIFLSFVFANELLNWDIYPLAAGVIGGMLAWYATGILAAFIDWRKGRAAKRRSLD